jgi:ribonuclease P protein component
MPGLGGALAGEPDERLTRRDCLRQRSDYLQCYRQGRRRHGPLFTLHFFANTLGHPRLGITASKKVGNSVVRHRLKRWSREVFRRWEGRPTLSGLDLVLHLKPESAAAEWASYEGEMQRLLRSLQKGSGR